VAPIRRNVLNSWKSDTLRGMEAGFMDAYNTLVNTAPSDGYQGRLRHASLLGFRARNAQIAAPGLRIAKVSGPKR